MTQMRDLASMFGLHGKVALVAGAASGINNLTVSIAHGQLLAVDGGFLIS